MMSIVSSMVLLHLFDQDDKNEMQPGFSDHVMTLVSASVSVSCIANGIINGTTAFVQ